MFSRRPFSTSPFGSIRLASAASGDAAATGSTLTVTYSVATSGVATGAASAPGATLAETWSVAVSGGASGSAAATGATLAETWSVATSGTAAGYANAGGATLTTTWALVPGAASATATTATTSDYRSRRNRFVNVQSPPHELAYSALYVQEQGGDRATIRLRAGSVCPPDILEQVVAPPPTPVARPTVHARPRQLQLVARERGPDVFLATTSVAGPTAELEVQETGQDSCSMRAKLSWKLDDERVITRFILAHAA